MSLDVTAKTRRKWRVRLFDKQAGKCHWCGQPMHMDAVRPGMTVPLDYATFEHLIRRREGADDDPKNLVLAHSRCNRARN